MVLTGYFVISPVIGLCCHRHLANMAGPRPVGPTSPPQNLTPASRRQDHTTSPSAATSFVCAPVHRSRVGPRPAMTIARRRCRVHRIPCPTSVTIAKRPSRVGRDGGSSKDASTNEGSGIFLRRRLDDPNHVDPAREFRPYAHRSVRAPDAAQRAAMRRGALLIRGPFCSRTLGFWEGGSRLCGARSGSAAPRPGHERGQPPLLPSYSGAS